MTTGFCLRQHPVPRSMPLVLLPPALPGTCVLSVYTAVKLPGGNLSDSANGTAMLGVTGA